MKDAEQRLVDLEVRYTHADTLLRELNDVVYAQQKTIDGLVKRVKALEERLRSLGEEPPGEPPPHY